AQDEVFVRNGGPVAQTYMRAVYIGPFNVDCVSGRVNTVDDQAGIKRDIERDVMTGTRSRGSDFRVESGSVRHCRSVRLTCFWDVTRGDHHGKYKLVCAVFVLQRFDITDGDLDLLAGQNVGYGLRKDIWSLLVQQSCDLSA